MRNLEIAPSNNESKKKLEKYLEDEKKRQKNAKIKEKKNKTKKLFSFR